MLKVQQISKKETWESFLKRKEITFSPFFQLWEWGDVQERLGFEVLRLGIFDSCKSQNLVGICLVVIVRAKRGHYLHLRHGPVFLEYNHKYLYFFLDYVREMGKREKTSFIRISPLITKEVFDAFLLNKKRFINSPIHNMDTETCWILDISKSEDQLFREMRKTHRYLIRKGQSTGVRIRQTKKNCDIEFFLNLYQDLSQRKHFIPHRGIKEEFEIFSKENKEVLLLAEYENKMIAGALVVFLQDMAIYRHGATSTQYKNIPASYLLQWEAIREAKKRGIRFYNFWGISPTDAKNHPWQGLTLFKMGFGGERKEFIHAQDLPVNTWYWKTYIIEYLNKVIRGY